jgi:hypothetical protein
MLRGLPRRSGTSIASVVLAVSGCVASSVQPVTVPLVYRPSPRQLGLVDSFPCNAVARVQASDARSEKTLGMRTHESKPLKAEVSASGDAGSWVEDGVQKYLTQSGIHFQGGGPELALSLDSLRTSESILRRSSYEARIALSSRLQTSAGKSCWQGRIEGASGNYGYSGSIVDYQETLNGALTDALLRMAQSQGFRDALCHCAD